MPGSARSSSPSSPSCCSAFSRACSASTRSASRTRPEVLARLVLVVPALLLGFGATGALYVNTIAGLLVCVIAAIALRSLLRRHVTRSGAAPRSSPGRGPARRLARVRLADERRHSPRRLLLLRQRCRHLRRRGAPRQGRSLPPGGDRDRAAPESGDTSGRRVRFPPDPAREPRRDAGDLPRCDGVARPRPGEPPRARVRRRLPSVDRAARLVRSGDDGGGARQRLPVRLLRRAEGAASRSSCSAAAAVQIVAVCLWHPNPRSIVLVTLACFSSVLDRPRARVPLRARAHTALVSAAGELRYRLRCIDKLGHTFGGNESLLDVGCGNGGVASPAARTSRRGGRRRRGGVAGVARPARAHVPGCRRRESSVRRCVIRSRALEGLAPPHGGHRSARSPSTGAC